MDVSKLTEMEIIDMNNDQYQEHFPLEYEKMEKYMDDGLSEFSTPLEDVDSCIRFIGFMKHKMDDDDSITNVEKIIAGGITTKMIEPILRKES